MSALAIDLRGTPASSSQMPRDGWSERSSARCTARRPETPDALSVRSGWLARRRRLVPAESIEQIDGGSKVIGLRVERESIRTFL